VNPGLAWDKLVQMAAASSASESPAMTTNVVKA
jgi:hypothetical protein